MRRLLIPISALLAGIAPSYSATPSPESLEQARRFGALESVEQISISPDGAHTAFIGNHPQGQMVFVADVDAGGLPASIFTLPYNEGNLTWCRWVSNGRLICEISYVVDSTGTKFGMTRLFAINSDGSQPVKLTAGTSDRALGYSLYGGDVLDWDVKDEPGSVLMMRNYVPESDIGSNIRRDDEGMGVELLDTVSLKRRKYELPRRDAREFITDGHGAVRVMGTLGSTEAGLKREIRYFYRKTGSREWLPLSTVDLLDPRKVEFNPYAVDRSRNVVYGFGDNNGTKALFSISLDNPMTREVVLARSDVDIDQLVRIGREGRVVGASYATERRTVEFFDPELRKLRTALGRALPGNPDITFVDSSADETRLLLMASSDTNSGVFYIYDKTSRKLAELLPVRSELQGVALAPVKPVTYAAADGTQIPGYLTLPRGSTGKGLPAIVIPHGGPGARDEFGFDWLAQYFAARGYAVLQPNFRGSAGYGAAWYQKNGFQSWRIAIGDINDAGRWLVDQGIAAPKKLGIVGWSYGGYAALQSSVIDADLFKAIVAIAPVTDLEQLRQQSAGYGNFTLVDEYIGQGPHVREGSPAQNAQLIKAPVLMFHGTFDRNVDIDQSRLMEKRLRGAGKQVTLIEFPNLAHGLSDASARARMLSETDAFLRENFGLTP